MRTLWNKNHTEVWAVRTTTQVQNKLKSPPKQEAQENRRDAMDAKKKWLRFLCVHRVSAVEGLLEIFADREDSDAWQQRLAVPLDVW